MNFLNSTHAPDNTDNIDNIDNIDNTDNIHNIDNMDNMDNMDNIHNMDNMDNTDNIHNTDNMDNMDTTKIFDNLKKLYESNNIPNIIFHGPNMSGKKTLLENFLKLLYKTSTNIKKFSLVINCSHGKGNIKFIRENLKYFANSIIHNNNTNLFKSIILLNADNLTIDAQSALRRLIELHN